MELSSVSHAGVCLHGLGRGPRARSLLAASLPCSFIPKEIVGSLEEAGHGWGELFLVIGSLSQAPGARVTGRELFAFPPVPLGSPLPGPRGTGLLPACHVTSTILPGGCGRTGTALSPLPPSPEPGPRLLPWRHQEAQ